MRWGRYARWPMKWGGGIPLAKRTYLALRDARGTYYSSDDSAIANQELACLAFALARGQRAQMRGALQAFPGLATDCLTDWEQRLGRVPDPREYDWQRRNFLEGIIAGTLPPSYDNIVAAVSKVLDGEAVSLVTARAKIRTTAAAPFTLSPLPALTEVLGGGLPINSLYAIGLAAEDAAGKVTWIGNAGAGLTITLGSGGSIRVNQSNLANFPAGTDRVHYYLSVKAGDTSNLAYVATNRGESIVLSALPANPGVGGLHHVSVVVSEATWLDLVKRTKINELLGRMLSAWTTFDTITSSPFLVSGGTPAGSRTSMGGI